MLDSDATGGPSSIYRVVSSDGSRIGVERIGRGPHLVMVHGGTADRTRWSCVALRLAERFTLHLLDRRGRGLSVCEAPGSYSLAREARDIASVIDAVGEPVVALGHSFGALCLLESAFVTDGLSRLLLYEPSIPTARGPIFPPGALEAIGSLLEHDEQDAALQVFFTRVLGVDLATLGKARRSPAWRARLRAVPTLLREGDAAERYRLDGARLGGLRTPTSVVYGTRTAPAFIAAALALHAAIPTSELVALPNLGHTAMDQDPDQFAETVLELCT